MGWFAMFQVAFLLVVSISALAGGIMVFRRPGERSLRLLRVITATVVFSILSAIFSGVGTAFQNAAELTGPETGDSLFYAGLTEAMVPAVFGFTVLAIGWLFAALGVRKHE